MVVTMLTGWSGRLQAVPQGGSWGGRLFTPPRLRPATSLGDDGVAYAVQRLDDRTLSLSAASADIALHKTIGASGDTVSRLRRGSDWVEVATRRRHVTVTRGRRSIALDLAALDETRLLQARGLLLSSRAVRVFRALAASLEDADARGVERVGTRVTGAAVACLDGDPGAFRRLSRELATHGVRSALSSEPPHVAALRCEYQQTQVNARTDLVGCRGPLFWNPLQIVWGFDWLQQVEAAWYRLVTGVLETP